MRTVQLVVLRPFAIRGQRQEVGTVVEVDASTAAELRACNKAGPVPTANTATPDTAPARAARVKKEPQS